MTDEAAVSRPSQQAQSLSKASAYQLAAVRQSVTDVTAQNHGLGIIAVAFGSLHTVEK